MLVVSSSSILGSHGEAVDAEKSCGETSQLEDKVGLLEALTINKGLVFLVLAEAVEVGNWEWKRACLCFNLALKGIHDVEDKLTSIFFFSSFLPLLFTPSPPSSFLFWVHVVMLGPRLGPFFLFRPNYCQIFFSHFFVFDKLVFKLTFSKTIFHTFFKKV